MSTRSSPRRSQALGERAPDPVAAEVPAATVGGRNDEPVVVQALDDVDRVERATDLRRDDVARARTLGERSTRAVARRGRGRSAGRCRSTARRQPTLRRRSRVRPRPTPRGRGSRAARSRATVRRARPSAPDARARSPDERRAPRRASPSTCRRAWSSRARRAPRPIRPHPAASCPRAARRRGRRRSCRRRRRDRGSRGRAAASRARSRLSADQATAPQSLRVAERTSRSVVATTFRFGNCAVASSIIASKADGSRPVRRSSTPATSSPRHAVKSSSLPISTSTLRRARG